MNALVYADSNATTVPATEVLAAVTDCLRQVWGNPSSKHRAGDAARARLGEARSRVAALVGAHPSEIVFTSGATESNQLVLAGALLRDPLRRHIVAGATEHPSILRWLEQSRQWGVRVSLIPVDRDGVTDLDRLRAEMTPQTALVSLMWVNNETGVIQPVREAAEIAASCGVPFHTDAVQAVGRLPVDVRAAPFDLLSFSGHKLHAPKGVGVLWLRKGLVWPAFAAGQQERGRRGGTENVPAIVGLGVAASLCQQGLAQDMPQVAQVRDTLEQALSGWAVAVHGGRVARVGNTSHLLFGGITAAEIIERLDQQGICVSGGSACSSHGNEPSHVLQAMGCESVQSLASVRFSFSRYSTVDEALQIAQAVRDILPARPQARKFIQSCYGELP